MTTNRKSLTDSIGSLLHRHWFTLLLLFAIAAFLVWGYKTNYGQMRDTIDSFFSRLSR